jgi:hypothetical protein
MPVGSELVYTMAAADVEPLLDALDLLGYKAYENCSYVNNVSREATVPDSFEGAGAVLIVETDTWEIVDSLASAPMEHVQKIIDHRCEAVVCLHHIGQECFDPIADESITRYNGEGLNVMEASVLADRNRCPSFPSTRGGPGAIPARVPVRTAAAPPLKLS